MKKCRLVKSMGVIGLAALLLAACGGGGGGGGGANAPGGGTGGGSVSAALLELFDLTDLGGGFSAAVAVNNAAPPVTVGFSADGSQTVKATTWTIGDGELTDPVELSPLPGNTYSAAYGINSAGIAVGESGAEALIGGTPVPDHHSTAVFWPSAAAIPTALSVEGLFAGGDSVALAISSSGAMVGEAADNEQGDRVAVYWAGPGAAPLVLPHLSSAGDADSSAQTISDNGLIAGESRNAAGRLQAVIWRPAATGGYAAPVALTPFIDQAASSAFAIDPAGNIVGTAEIEGGTLYGVIWNNAGSVTADLGPNTAALAVNGAGHIAGHSAAQPGDDQATIWNAADPDDYQVIEAVFSQAYGINDRMQVVGMFAGRAIAALPR